eukprot:CAMPEP_0183723096 /NCGR_PEP_ID=MMETSP0737-20130205/14814_1 /TAXON_ID=385413 /ORGANISM="Thalassiosira miniscula, Strain CCMP1093" /LENGTH=255 /DNA_ID=CAMNT_0025953347 /DNA_START=209 /DNA_END=976 /DNA_ORIENTATION=-
MGSSNQMTQEEIQYLTLLLGIIRSKNWQAFGYAIISNPDVFQSFSRTLSRSSELNGMTILHACVRYNPPVHIVKILLALVPEASSCVDCLRRTPLHVAAGTRAGLPLIKLLVEAHPAACDVQDKDGKTPLHLACDIACELFNGDRDKAREPPSYNVVKTLLRASPLAAPVEDNEGMSALEYAIFSDASVAVVKLLQYETKRQCETQRRSNVTLKNSRPSDEEKSTIEDEEYEFVALIPSSPPRKGGFLRRRPVRS